MTEARPRRGPLRWGGRLPIPAVVALATLLTFGTVAIGGVPLLAGLVLATAVAMAALPPSSRRYLVRRSGRVIVTIVATMAIVWFLVHNYPDASRDTPTGVVPAMERYVAWFGDVLLGDFGPSAGYSETVTEGVGRTIPISAQLVLYSQIIAVVIATPNAENAERAVLNAALAAPSCSDGTSRSAAAFAGPSMNAMPSPIESVPGRNART